MAVVKKISELVPKGSALGVTDLLVVGVDNGTDYDLKSVTGAQLLGTVVSQTITNGDTSHSPSSDVVFDALALKVDKVTGSRLITSAEGTILSNTSGTNSGDETVTTIKNKLGITTLSGSNTGDQDLSSYATNSSVVKLTGDQTISGIKTLTNELKLNDKLYLIETATPAAMTGYTTLTSNGSQFVLQNGASTAAATFVFSGARTYTLPNSTGTLSLTSDLTSKVDGNTAITGATKTKITYDSKGLVTNGTDATTADIADSLNKRYVTDANLTVIGNTSGTNTGDQIISDATITTTDITTNNFSTTKHGFVPKGTNVGNYLKDDGTWSTISAGGLTYFTEAQSTASPNNLVNVDSLTAIASTTNADFVVRPKGTGSILAQIPDGTASGGDKRGQYAVDLQLGRSNQAYVAKGANSFIAGGYGNSTSVAGTYSLVGGYESSATGSRCISFGTSNKAAGYCATSFGESCQANGDNSFAVTYAAFATGFMSVSIGRSSQATGTYSQSLGAFNASSATSSTCIGQNNTADGINSTAIGYNANVYGLTGRFVFASNNTDAQKSFFMLRQNTTSVTPAVMSVTGGAASSVNQLTLQNNNVFRVKGSITGKQSASTNVGVWDIDCVIVRGANAASTVIAGSANVNLVVNTGSFGTPTLTANTTLGCLTVTVIGVAATNIQWTCAIDTTEVIYA